MRERWTGGRTVRVAHSVMTKMLMLMICLSKVDDNEKPLPVVHPGSIYRRYLVSVRSFRGKPIANTVRTGTPVAIDASNDIGSPISQ
jgi:hypothetical protein